MSPTPRPLTSLAAGFLGLALWTAMIMAGSARLGPPVVPIPQEPGPQEQTETVTGGAATEIGRPDEANAEGPNAEGANSGGAPEATAPVIESRQVRVIEPDLFASPLAAGEAPLERVEARAPITDAKDLNKPLRLPRPETVEAGILAFGASTLKLKDLVPTNRLMTCPRKDGGSWPCGMVARTQQRLFLRNRTAECDVNRRAWAGSVTSRCRVGGVDIAEWLATNGWAVAEDGSPLAVLTEAARAERRGIFGDPLR